MNKKIIWGLIVAVVVIGLIVVGVRRGGEKEEGGPIKIGFIGALTGDLASLGEEAKNSLTLAVKEINESGGIKGRQVEVIYEDTKCSGKEAASAVSKLVNIDRVAIIFGGTCSTETLAAVPITEGSETLLFTSWSLNPQITLGNDFVFRNAPSDTVGAKAVAKLAYNNGVRKISIITQSNDDYAIGFEKIFSNEFKNLGGEITHIESFNSESGDLRTTVLKTLNVESDAILINPQGNPGGQIAKLLKEFNNKKPLYGNVTFADSNVIKNYAPYLEGGYTSEPANLDVNNDEVADYLQKYKQEFKSEPQYLFWTAASYDAFKIYAEAVKEVGYNSIKIKDYFYNIDEYNGVLGKYRFDENGDVIGIDFDNKQIRNGQLELIK